METFNTTTQALKIYKYNPLIKGKIVGKLTDFDFLLQEILLRLVQQEIRQYLYCEFTAHNFHVPLDVLKKLLYGENKAPKDWLRDVKESLEKLRALTIVLKNYEVPEENFLLQEQNIMEMNKELKTTKKVDFAAFGLCEEPEIRENILYWRFNKYMVFWAWYKKDYTHLGIEKIRTLKSKYSQRIYEYIEYYRSLNDVRGNKTKLITLNKWEFEDIISLKNDSVAVLFQKIHLETTTLPELKKIYPNIEIKSPKRSNVIEIDLGE
uniref:Initiator Rep protein domain-containing protein n=1 Tax=uncultured prokaryote TaxID=198431 RepID=A0A0H5PXC7_9ZZZZ|nr:hypothetical protein [uncultured prokaryote]